MNAEELLNALKNGAYDRAFTRIYPGARVRKQRERYIAAAEGFAGLNGNEGDIYLFSAPGRTEIGGNHTDHQRGMVLAAAVDLDIVCAASVNGDNIIRIKSEGHKQAVVDLSSLSPVVSEQGSSVSLVRGIAARCRELGYAVGGFDAYTLSDVPKGSGLSSSAAFEVAVGTIISHLFNGGAIPATDIAQIGMYAENSYFGKPSGLMDQMACSVGGLALMDFYDKVNPEVERVNFDFASCGHALCIVNTGGSHSWLTAEYAAVTAEMKAVAGEFGADCLRNAGEKDFYAAMPALREKHGDRAVLRAMHFFSENARVPRMKAALLAGDFRLFKELSVQSGESSFSCLQNVILPGETRGQGIALALAASKRILEGRGAWRVHGGGFMGTIQAFVPDGILQTYISEMERIFGEGSCMKLSVRPVGGTQIKPDTYINAPGTD